MTESQIYKVSREELIGYRQPTSIEKDGIYHYMRFDGKRTLRAMAVWIFVCAGIGSFVLLGLIMGIGQIPTGEIIMGTVIFLAAAIAVLILCLNYKSIQRLLDQAETGEYQVMDCYVYEAYFSSQISPEAAVKVRNDHGQYCTFDFTLDRDTAQQCQTDPETRILLAKFSDKRYELISQKRMELG